MNRLPPWMYDILGGMFFLSIGLPMITTSMMVTGSMLLLWSMILLMSGAMGQAKAAKQKQKTAANP